MLIFKFYLIHYEYNFVSNMYDCLPTAALSLKPGMCHANWKGCYNLVEVFEQHSLAHKRS